MTAKQIFKNLGYKEYKNYRLRTHEDIIAYKNEEIDCYIYFYKSKKVELRCDIPLDMVVFKAIIKQAKELGWDNE